MATADRTALAELRELDNYKRWQSITEESIYLQDGILRTMDLVPNKFGIKIAANNRACQRSSDLSEPSSATADSSCLTDCGPEDLLTVAKKEETSSKILKLCSRNLAKAATLQEYQMSLLHGLWLYKYGKARPRSQRFGTELQPTGGRLLSGSVDIERNSDTEQNHEQDEENAHADADPANLSSKLSLLLMVPLLKSHATADERIVLSTMTLIVDMLSHFAPMSLQKDVPEPLNTLEGLLCEWIATKGLRFQPIGPSSLLALACARGTMSSILKTFDLLRRHVDPGLVLPVAKFVKKLEKLGVRRGEPCKIQKSRRVRAWPFDDQLNPTECGTAPSLNASSANSGGNAEPDNPPSTQTPTPAARRRNVNRPTDTAHPSIATDSQFLFLTGSRGKGLVKIGTGLDGTLQGWIYNRNKSFDGGFLAFGRNCLLSRPEKYDQLPTRASTDADELVPFVDLICLETLAITSTLKVRVNEDLQAPFMTVGFTSDGDLFYLVRVGLPANSNAGTTRPESEKAILPVFVDVFELPEPMQENATLQLRSRITVTKNMAQAEPIVNKSSNATRGTQYKFHKFESWNASVGLTLKQLLVSYMFCNGMDLTIMTNAFENESGSTSTGSNSTGTGTAAVVTHAAGSSGIPTIPSILHGPISALHPRKSFETSGVEIHIDLCPANRSYTREEVPNCPLVSYGQHGTHFVPAAAYDTKHNLIWVVSSDNMHAYKNSGYRPSWYRERQFMYQRNDSPEPEMNASQVGNYLLTHAGIMASNFLATRSGSKEMNQKTDIGFSPSNISSVVATLKEHLRTLSGTEFVSIFVILQAMISQIKKSAPGIEASLNELQDLLMELIQNPWFLNLFQFQSLYGIHYEIAKLFAGIYEHLPSPGSKSVLLTKVDEIGRTTSNDSWTESASTKQLSQLINQVILKQLTSKLHDYGLLYPEGFENVLDTEHLGQLIENSASTTCAAFDEFYNLTDFGRAAKELPVITPETLYLNAVVNYLQRSWSLRLIPLKDELNEELASLVLRVFRLVVSASTSILQKVVQSINTAAYSYEAYLYIENTLKTSMVGLIIPKIVTMLSQEALKVNGEHCTKTVSSKFVSFIVVISHLANLMNQSPGPDADAESDFAGDDWTLLTEYAAPWTMSRYAQSIHPIKENVKMKETITIPNARRLYVKFDHECATQYEYDKLVLYAGVPNAHGTGQIVNEYDGNCFGFGGHAPGNWPTRLVAIDGDTMSYSFENRSAREHSTPDKACWGFGFTIYPKFESTRPYGMRTEETNANATKGVLPEAGLVNSIAIAALELLLHLNSKLIDCDDLSDAEVKSGLILDEPAFARFKWNPVAVSQNYDSLNLISKDQIEFFRRSSESIGKPQMSARMREKIKPDSLEQLFFAGYLRCLTDVDTNHFQAQDSDATCLLLKSGRLLAKIFQIFDVIVRHLMALVELQWRFENEVDDMIQNLKDADEFFFCDPSFQADMDCIEQLAYICDVDFDPERKENTLHDIRNIADAFCSEGTRPSLHRAEEVIEETFRKCLFLATDETRHCPRFPDNPILQWTSELGEFSRRIKRTAYFLLSLHSNAKPMLSLDDYRLAVQMRRRRAEQRHLALENLIRILQLSLPNAATLEMAAVLLSKFSEEESALPCQIYDERIHELFGQCIKLVVQIAEKKPLLFRVPIAALCLLPYKRNDEAFLVQSGLLSLADRLCAYQVPNSEILHASRTSPSGVERVRLSNRASTLGWAAFQVLASRCSAWNTFDMTEPSTSNSQANSLATQISLNIANHLLRSTKCSRQANSTRPTDSIQEVLSLLDSLRESQLGRQILKQSTCIGRLFVILQDSTLSPRLVLIILRLLGIALPRAESLNLDDLPQGSIPGIRKRTGAGTSSQAVSSPQYVIASLLFGKLSDFLICGNPQLLTSSSSASNGKCSKDEYQATMNVWIIQNETLPRLRPLFEPEQDNFRPPNVNHGDMEATFEKDGKILVFPFETPDSAAQKAQRLAQIGFTVSLERSDTVPAAESSSSLPKNSSPETTCKLKNAKLSAIDPPRVFISGEVAQTLAKSIIGLIRSLLSSTSNKGQEAGNTVGARSSSTNSIYSAPSTDPNEESSQSDSNRQDTCAVWKKAFEDSLNFWLKPITKLCSLSQNAIVGSQVDSFGYSARLAIAALAVLGSFTETVDESSVVIVDKNMEGLGLNTLQEKWPRIPILATVLELDNVTNTATVELLPNQGPSIDKYVPSKTLKVPTSRLSPKSDAFWTPLPELSITAQKQVASCLKSLLIASKLGDCPLKQQLPSFNHLQSLANSSSAGSTGNNLGADSKQVYSSATLVRLIAEVRARSAHVLSVWLKDPTFSKLFLGVNTEVDARSDFKLTEESENVLKNLKSLAKGLKPADRLESVKLQVAGLRIIQRDSTKPQRPLKASVQPSIHWDYQRQYPPIKNCVFSNGYTGIKYCGDGAISIENPRGVLSTSNVTIPARGVYFEVQIKDLGEVTHDAIAGCAIGFVANLPSSNTDRLPWVFPAGSVLLNSNGRITHYAGANVASWESERIEHPFNVGDKIGIGWELVSETLRRTAVTFGPRPPRPPPPPPPRSRPRQASFTNITNMSSNLASDGTNARGRLFVTVNGVREATTMFLDLESSMCWPCVHLQKTNAEVVANFGGKPFAYQDGNKLGNGGIATAIPIHRSVSGSPIPRPLRRITISDSEESLVDFSDQREEADENMFLYPFPHVEQSDSESEVAFQEAEDEPDGDDDMEDDDESEPVSGTSSHNSLTGVVPRNNVIVLHEADVGEAGLGQFHPAQRVEDDEDFATLNITSTPNVQNQAPIEFIRAPDRTATAGGSATATSQISKISANNDDKIVAKVVRPFEYSHWTSMEYHLSPSSTHDIRVFSGPRAMCQCAGGAKDNNGKTTGSSLPSEGQEDVNELLVKAWEAKVFPIIRRRFRNESERLEGLDQIRGALLLGMADIARQTVEYLYEEGSTMPRDLHFPTIEEIIEETRKFTMKKVHVGMHVAIRNLPSDDTEFVLPNFAVRDMLSTFGLAGDVLELDVNNELVLVEAYVPTEGVLTRFWYPLKFLERAKQRSSVGKPKGMNLSKLHSNLVTLETSLSQFYCRDSVLTLLDSYNLGKFGEHSVDFEAILLRSQANFKEMPPNGDLFSWNLEYGTPPLEILTNPRNPTSLFYSDPDMLLKQLANTVEFAVSQGEDAVNALVNRVCSVFEITNEGFSSAEVPLEKEDDFEVVLPDSAFTLVTFTHPSPSPTHKPPALSVGVGEPCVHIRAFNGSDFKTYLLACYPAQLLHGFHNSDSPASSMFKHKYPFPAIMAPTERLSVKISGTGLKDNFLQIQGIPAQFPVAVSFCQTFLKFSYDHKDKISGRSILNFISVVSNFIKSKYVSPLIKEWLYSIISDGLNQITDAALIKEFYASHESFIQELFVELVYLYNKETKPSLPSNLKPTDVSSPAEQSLPLTILSRMSLARGIALSLRSIAIGSSAPKTSSEDQHGGVYAPLSSYLQSLIELCVSLTFIKDTWSKPEPPTPEASLEKSPALTPEKRISPTSVTSTGGNSTVSKTSNAEKSKAALSVHRKVSALQQQPKKPPPKPDHRKTTDNLNLTRQKGRQSSNLAVENYINSLSVKRQAKPAGPESVVALMKEESFLQNEIFSWFHKILLSHALLKVFVCNEVASDSLELMERILPDVLRSMNDRTNHARLFVICGAPHEIHQKSVETSIHRGLNEAGGLYANELWISEETNDAVIEIRSSCKKSEAFEILKRNRTWYPIEDYILYPSVDVYQVTSGLEIGERRADVALSCFLRSKILDKENKEKMSTKCEEVLSYIYTTCYATNEKLGCVGETQTTSNSATICLNAFHLLNKDKDNLMFRFIESAKPKNYTVEDYVKDVLKWFGQKRVVSANPARKDDSWPWDLETDAPPNAAKSRRSMRKEPGPSSTTVQDLKDLKASDTLSLTQSEFIQWCTVLGKDNIYGLWKGLLSTGFDIRLDRTKVSDIRHLVNYMVGGEWTKEQDAALVTYMDNLAQVLRIPPNSIHPHEIYFEETQLMDPSYQVLRNVSFEFIRTRCCILQFLNTNVLANLLPYFPLHNGTFNKSGVGTLLHDARHLLFFHTKDEFLSQVLQHSAFRSPDFAPPDVILDPVQSIGKTVETGASTSFCKGFLQLEHFPSLTFTVPPNSGSDPPLPMLVKYSGEEVLGTIGSFRHFLSSSADELRNLPLNVLIKCPSSHAGRNKDTLVLRPGPLSIGEEKLLQYFGKFLGICIRSDTPLPLQLLPTTWRSLLRSPKDINDDSNDLVEADILTSSLIKSLQMVDTPELISAVLTDNGTCTFEWPSMDRDTMVALCPGGSAINVSLENKERFIGLLKELRNRELLSSNRVRMILAGLSTVVPLPVFFNIFTSPHLELRISGSPQTNLALLKSHTHYQVGISDHDLHILYFWAVLESMSPQELKNFIKFATNQERLPITCPCQNRAGEVKTINQVHVPPFPMKIAPIALPSNASREYIDKQTIRAETCLFLVRLPPYSSYQITREQVLFACNSRDDPLSG